MIGFGLEVIEERSALELTPEGLRTLWVRGRTQERGGTLHLREVHGLSYQEIADELRRLAPLCSREHRAELYQRAVAQLVGLGELGEVRGDRQEALKLVQQPVPVAERIVLEPRPDRL